MAEYQGNLIPDDPVAEDTFIQVTTENLLDKIAESLILNRDLNVSQEFLQHHQKTIKNGILQVGRDNSDKLILYQSDVRANEEDLLGVNENLESFENIVQQLQDAQISLNNVNIHVTSLGNNNSVVIMLTISGGLLGPYNLTNILSYVDDSGTRNPINISQFINVTKETTSINIPAAEEYLDTNIYELLPTTSLRQERIDNAINEFRSLLPPALSTTDFGIDDDGRVDLVDDTTSEFYGEWIGSQQYYLDNTISAPQNNEEGAGEEEEGFITRLAKNVSTENEGQSIEEIRDLLNTYLRDIDEPEILAQDDRPLYNNISDGYLKFRNLNQGIIVRNTQQDFVEGLNPETLEYLETGFTITMWVRFLDKVSEGTLFNFGNPLRGDDTSFGFKLETYMINKDDNIEDDVHSNFGELVEANGYLKNELQIFQKSDSERFVRLVVNDNDTLRDSHIGNPSISKLSSGNIPILGNETSNEKRLLSNQLIPADFNEWYFICATFNPDILEDESYGFDGNDTGTEDYQSNSDFWLNHINPFDGTSVVNSNYGNRCKLEIISKSDLLRARGFRID